MIEKKDILKMIKHVSRRSQGVKDKRVIHPNRDWLWGMVIFLGVVLIGGIDNLLSFQRLSTLESDIEPTESKTIKYKDRVVESVLDSYRTRQTEYEKLRASAPRPVAPAPSDSIESAENTNESDLGITTEPEESGTSTDSGVPEEGV